MWEQRDILGELCVKIMLAVSFLEWLTCLFLFIMVEFKSYYTALYLKMVLIFSCYESLPKGSQEILCHAVVGDKVLWYPEWEQPPPPFRENRPVAAQLNSPFSDVCFL